MRQPPDEPREKDERPNLHDLDGEERAVEPSAGEAMPRAREGSQSGRSTTQERSVGRAGCELGAHPSLRGAAGLQETKILPSSDDRTTGLKIAERCGLTMQGGELCRWVGRAKK